MSNAVMKFWVCRVRRWGEKFPLRNFPCFSPSMWIARACECVGERDGKITVRAMPRQQTSPYANVKRLGSVIKWWNHLKFPGHNVGAKARRAPYGIQFKCTLIVFINSLPFVHAMMLLFPLLIASLIRLVNVLVNVCCCALEAMNLIQTFQRL